MKLNKDDVIKINQEVFDFLYQFQYGGTAIGYDYYIVTKVTAKYYYLKEMSLHSGLRYTKKEIQLNSENFHHMTNKYNNLVEKVTGEERLSVLTKILIEQIRVDAQESGPNTLYLKELISA